MPKHASGLRDGSGYVQQNVRHAKGGPEGPPLSHVEMTYEANQTKVLFSILFSATTPATNMPRSICDDTDGSGT